MVKQLDMMARALERNRGFILNEALALELHLRKPARLIRSSHHGGRLSSSYRSSVDTGIFMQ